MSDARNAGMAVATGELMTFVDSDDWIDPDMYKHLYQRMVEDYSDIAACGVQMVWEDGTPPRILTRMGNHVLSKEEAMQAIIEESWLKQPVWYKLYKTNLIKDILFPVENTTKMFFGAIKLLIEQIKYQFRIILDIIIFNVAVALWGKNIR